VRSLRLIALVSLVYDGCAGILLLAAREWLAGAFGVPSPQPPIFVETTGLFLIAVAAGYVLPYRRPDQYRGYLWVMGPLLKGGGALTFVADHLAHGTPTSFLLFAVSDGVLALLTLWALLATGAHERGSARA
jgi:hypothetical protein